MRRLRPVLCLAAAVATLAAGPTVPAQASTSAKVLTAASLNSPASGPYGSSIWLTGTLWRYGTSTKVAGATVYLQRSPHGRNTWANLRSAVTNSSGGYAFAVVQTGAYDYRARYYGSATYTGALSRVRYPVTTQKVLFDGISTTSYSTGAVRATGRVYPTPPNRTPVLLYRWDAAARKWVGTATGYTSGNAVTISTVRPASVASYRLVVGARAPWGAGLSAPRTFAHYRWRGIFARPVNGASGPGGYFVRPPAESPTRTRVHLSVDPSPSPFILAMNTTGCSRFVALTTPTYLPGPVTLIWDSDRLLTQATLNPGNPPHQADYALHPSENELRLWLTNGQSSSSAQLESDIKVLCSN